MASGPITSWQIDGENVNSVRFHFLGLQNQCGWWLQSWNWKKLAPWKNSYDKPRQCIKSRALTSLTKFCIVKAMVFPSSHVWIWELGHKECWVLKNWHLRTVVLEKTLESPLDSKEIKPVNPKGIQPWIFIVRTGAEAETPILWPPDVKTWLTGKDPDAGKDWRQEEKGMTEDKMVEWHHWLNGQELEQTRGDSDGWWSLACCNSWGCKE